jgi:hypothetical protein
MPIKTQTYAVLIASPSDLTAERDLIVQVIAEWNALHAIEQQSILLPVRWETHSSPQYNVRPQQALDDQLVNKCDILIGMFWTKLGTPTGVAPSGTVEEIEKFAEAEKPILLYFSNRPIDPEKLDQKQQRKLRAFKQKTYQHALVGSFKTLPELRRKITRDLLAEVRKLKARYPIRTDKLERALRATELLRIHKKENISVEEFKRFERDLLASPSRRKEPQSSHEVGPSGFPVKCNKAGNKVEMWPDDDRPGKFFPVVIRRNDNAVNGARTEFWDKVWWNRHQNWLYRLENGLEKLSPGQKAILNQAKENARKIEKKYGKKNLGWDDFEWGMVNGKLSALNWVMGDEWDFLDT